MNRAILIVICDFIVSAMLSLATDNIHPGHPGHPAGGRGVALDNRSAAIVLQELRKEQLRLAEARNALAEQQFRQGFDAAREAAMQDMAKQLAESRMRSEILERKLSLTRENTGSLTPEQLQKQLEKEITRRYMVRQQHQDAVRELEHMSAEYASLKKLHSQGQQELAHAKAVAEERGNAVKAGEARLAETRDSLESARTALAVSRNELEKLGRLNTEYQARRSEFESRLSFTRGRLSATERELAETKSRLEKARKDASVRELELTEERRRRNNMQSMLKNAVSDRSKAAAELAEYRKKNGQLAGELQNTKARLADLEEKTRSDVLMRYSEAVMKLDLSMKESHMLIPVSTEAELFLPLVSLGGRSCLIGDFPVLTGGVRNRLDFDSLRQLSYSAALPDGGSPRTLPGPLYVPRSESRVGLLEVAGTAGRTPLNVLSFSQLKKRGIQELYLFKSSAFGKESCDLTGRVSMDFSGQDKYLYIHNNPRGSSVMRAEPGDFILTRQGEFAAVAVAVENPDFGRKQETRCVVFPDAFSWDDCFVLPYSGSAEAFAGAAAPVLEDIAGREKARR